MNNQTKVVCGALVRTDNGLVRTVLGRFCAGTGFDYLLLREFETRVNEEESATKAYLESHRNPGEIQFKLLRDSALYQWCLKSRVDLYRQEPAGQRCIDCTEWFPWADVKLVVNGKHVLVCDECMKTKSYKYKNCPYV
jgi:hypothetical protein